MDGPNDFRFLFFGPPKSPAPRENNEGSPVRVRVRVRFGPSRDAVASSASSNCAATGAVWLMMAV